MSYSIFYRAMFIRLSDGTFIPMIESGDNNVWDVDRNRRSRSWSACRWNYETDEQKACYSLTQNEILDLAYHNILKYLDQYAGKTRINGTTPYTKKEILDDLGYFNCIKVSGREVTSASRFMNFFKSGFRNAITFGEDICALSLSWYEKTENGTSFKKQYVASEQELREEWANHLANGIIPWIGIGECSAEGAWQSVRERNRRCTIQKKAPSELYIISFTYNSAKNYMVKIANGKLYCNILESKAHRYSSRKVAENAAKRFAKKYSLIKDIRVETVPVQA